MTASAATPAGSLDGPDSIAKNAGSYLVVQLISYSFTAVLTLFLVRALNPTGYGLLGFASAIGALLSFPADFGVSQSAARFVAENREDAPTVGRVISSALKIKLAVGGLTSLVLFIASEPLASRYGEPGLTWVLRAVSIAILAQALMSLLSYSLIALGRAAANLRVVLAQSVVEVSTSVILVIMGAGAAGAAFGRAASYMVGTVVAVAVVLRLLGPGSISLRSRGGHWMRRILRYGGALVIVDSAYALFGIIDILLVGAFLNAEAVGLFSAPLRLLIFMQLPAVAVSAGVSPRMVLGRQEPSTDAFVAGLRYIGILQAALVAPLLVWANPITDLLFGAGYEGSADVLRALTPFAFMLGFGTMLSMTANYLGLARPRIVVALVTVGINIVVDIIMIPRIGIVGGAVGTDLAYAFYAPAHLSICRRRLDFSIAPIVGGQLRALVASGVMGLVLLAFGTNPSAVGLVAGSFAGVLAFVATLIAARALSGSEIRAAARAALDALPRRAGA